MKKLLFLIYVISFSIRVLSQISSTGYSSKMNPPFGDQCTLETLKNYLSNSESLDPIEGLYDVKWTDHCTYTRYGLRSFEDALCVGVVKGQNGFYMYAPYNNGYSCQKWLLVQRIGDTPLYNFVYLDDMEVGTERLISTKERVLLKDNLFWEYSHTYSDSEKAHLGHDDVVVTNYTRTISAIKIFPTQSYNNANSPQWSGTGFAINNGYIATNYHVVEGAKNIKVKGIKGNFDIEYSARVACVDKMNDLAIIKIEDKKCKDLGVIPYKIKADASNVGEEIFVLGYPLTATMGDEIKLTTGVISAKTGFKGNAALYQISAPIQPGNSGGPLFDSHGNLIGIVNAKHKDAENVSYAIKVSYLLNLMKKISLKNMITQTNSISSLNLSGKVKKIKTSVFMIVCSK